MRIWESLPYYRVLLPCFLFLSYLIWRKVSKVPCALYLSVCRRRRICTIRSVCSRQQFSPGRVRLCVSAACGGSLVLGLICCRLEWWREGHPGSLPHAPTMLSPLVVRRKSHGTPSTSSSAPPRPWAIDAVVLWRMAPRALTRAKAPLPPRDELFHLK